MPHNPDHYAIVIGIECGGTLPPASRARQDALAIHEWLRNDGGGVPGENLHLIVSPGSPTLDREPPQRFELERAVRNIGILSGARVGRRLYVYFGGHAFRTAAGTPALLVTGVSSRFSPDSAVDLSDSVSSLSSSGAFEELVVWVDAEQINIQSVEAPLSKFPSVKPVTTAARSPTAIFALTSLSPQRGELTQRILECLSGRAGSTEGAVTSESLARFVREQQPHVANEFIGTHKITFVGAAARPVGTLTIEVPHWTTKLTIRDDRHARIPSIGEIEDDGQGRYASKTDLPVGIYQVEARLEDISEEQAVFVSGAGAKLGVERWRRLKVTSTAPVAMANNYRPEQGRLAAEWSRISTWSWSGAATADSRFFLFARAVVPELTPNFFTGLTLLNAAGEVVTDFAGAVSMDPASGCVAFNAALPAGYYVLRRRRSGLRPRSQPLFLCARWETQIFLAGRRYPNLETWTYNMAPLGVGYMPDEDIGIAAAVITDALHHGRDIMALLESSHMRILYDDKFDNPWLGVVAAYALLQNLQRWNQFIDPNVKRDRQHRFESISGVLKAAIGEHPDVRALLIEDHSHASEFTHPPLLPVGLSRVRSYAMKRPDDRPFPGNVVIPVGSLTDCVSESLLSSSAWTAWRYLARQPHGWAAEETGRGGSGPKGKQGRPGPPNLNPTAFASVLPPSMPVFCLAAQSSLPMTTAGLETATETIGAGWAEAALLYLAGKFLAGGLADSPDKLVIDAGQESAKMLAMIDQQQFASSTGISYEDPAQTVLELRERGATSAMALRPPHFGEAVRAIANNVLGKTGEEFREPSAARLTIEEFVEKLRGQAAFWHAKAIESGVDARMERFAESCGSVADALLARADYIGITDGAGRMLYGNGAFRCLIGGSLGAGEQQTVLHGWEAALRKAPLGQSLINIEGDVPTTAVAQSQREWRLRRIAVEDKRTGTELGYINVVRQHNAPAALAADALPRISKLLSELTVYIALLQIGPANRRYLDAIQTCIVQLEYTARN